MSNSRRDFERRGQIRRLSVALVVVSAFCVVVPVGALQRAAEKARSVHLVAKTEGTGITWRHDNAATEEKYLVETMGGGGALVDFDRDGLLDVFLVNSGATRAYKPKQVLRNALYRNRGDGTFEDVTEKARAGGNGSFGMGVAVGDIDNDGWNDLYVTAYGPNQLLRNRGDGTFEDITTRAGVGLELWSTSAAFLDFDRDGLLDLFVCNYCDWSPDKNPACGLEKPGMRAYCHPDLFNGLPSTLYRNLGNGRFEDVSKRAGIVEPLSKGLGVVTGDFDRDGWVDVFVANDAIQNFLFRNKGDGTFEEVSLLAEVAYATIGRPQSGMGCDFGDVDGDGWLDLVVTNLDQELNTIYRNNRDGTFSDVTIRSGLGSTSLLQSGFGVRFVDLDNDSDLDLFVTNGHILDNVHLFKEGVTYAEAPFVIENTGGGRLREATASFGETLKRPWVGRALAVGDVDNDGDSDLLQVNNGQPPVLFVNEGANRTGDWIGLELEGTKSNRNAIGARVTVTVGGRTIVREIAGGGSYCAAGDFRVLIGVGQARRADRVEIVWPSGRVERIDNMTVGKYTSVREGDLSKDPAESTDSKKSIGR